MSREKLISVCGPGVAEAVTQPIDPPLLTTREGWNLSASRRLTPLERADWAPKGTKVGPRDPRLMYHAEMLPVVTPALWRGLLDARRQLRKNRFRSIGRATDMVIDGDRGTGKTTLLVRSDRPRLPGPDRIGPGSRPQPHPGHLHHRPTGAGEQSALVAASCRVPRPQPHPQPRRPQPPHRRHDRARRPRDAPGEDAAGPHRRYQPHPGQRDRGRLQLLREPAGPHQRHVHLLRHRCPRNRPRSPLRQAAQEPARRGQGQDLLQRPADAVGRGHPLRQRLARASSRASRKTCACTTTSPAPC
ncbi:hypothetical protein SUDANB37_05752 (plasmid) [Streptomyces sp. enrichment culture]